MKVAVIAVSREGAALARQIQGLYPRAPIFVPARLVEKEHASSCEHFEGGLQDFVGNIFHRFEALVLVMAVGIAVRVTAPYLEGKTKDPAVVVIDDSGRFAISLLSGHLGGANDLAQSLAEALGAQPIITTSTDRHGVMAFDLLARRWGWVLENQEDLKKISTAQIRGKPLLVYRDENLGLELPGALGNIIPVSSGEELFAPGVIPAAGNIQPRTGTSGVGAPYRSTSMDRTAEAGTCQHPQDEKPAGVVFITNRRAIPGLPQELPFITLRPRNIVAGVGCRRGVPARSILDALEKALEEAGRSGESLMLLATAELKKNEQGLLLAAHKLEVPLRLMTAERIREVEELFEGSSFVRRQVGVSAVAEPCAYLGSAKGKLILRKRCYDGVTVALAESGLATV